MKSSTNSKQKPEKIYEIIKCDFQGEHCRLEQDSVHVLLQSPPPPSQHLQTTPSSAKFFENPAISPHTHTQLATMPHTGTKRDTNSESLILLPWRGFRESVLPSTTEVFSATEEAIKTTNNTSTWGLFLVITTIPMSQNLNLELQKPFGVEEEWRTERGVFGTWITPREIWIVIWTQWAWPKIVKGTCLVLWHFYI